MFQAAIKLLMITVFTLLLGFLAVFVVRQMGLHGSFATPTHPWAQRQFWWVFNPTAEELCQTKDLKSLLPGGQWIVSIPVKHVEEDWVVPCAKPQRLEEFLAHSEHDDWLLHVTAHDTWGLDELVAKVSPFDQNKHFAVLSDSQKVAVYLRKKAPQWLFAADSASLLRFRMFESMWIESAMDFWPDFLITSGNDSFHLDERGAAEMQRRKKRVLWTWDESTSKEPHIAIQGVMTKRPSAAQQKFGTRL
jgi:hypothetical protein